MDSTENKQNFYWDLGFSTFKRLETEEGILASGKEELYGCIFGRDSLITTLKLLRVYRKTGIEDFLIASRKVLVTMARLQGREINIESGEQPGKIIHEFRPDNHEFLTKALTNPWYTYPDGTMKIYDSVDSTPLFLIALYRYWQASGDNEFVEAMLPNAEAALQWLMSYADSNGDGFIDYQIDPERKHGGLVTQSWMDSVESVFHEDGIDVVRPIAPVEVQAYAYLGFKLWTKFFAQRGELERSLVLDTRAKNLKKLFNQRFVIYDDYGMYLAAGLDGQGKAMASIRSSMGHVLWAAQDKELDGAIDGILYAKYVPALVRRLMSPDIFAPAAGVRTLSSLSVSFDPNSYHNGSIWPHDNSLISEGLEVYGYQKKAKLIEEAILAGISHFSTPIELFVYDNNGHREYCSATGQKACKEQAWSAAAILDMTL